MSGLTGDNVNTSRFDRWIKADPKKKNKYPLFLKSGLRSVQHEY